MTSAEIIAAFKSDIKKHIEFAEINFLNLTEKQFNWRVNPFQWSTGQCIQHINMVQWNWIKQFEKIIKSGIKNKNNHAELKNPTGGINFKIVKKRMLRKMKSPAKYKPHFNVYSKGCMTEFFELQNRIAILSEKIEGFDFQKNKIKPHVFSGLLVSLAESFSLINLHTGFNLDIAFQVKSHPLFPNG